MRIADRSRAEGGRERIALVPESADDLWHLANVLEPGDLVAGDTSRRIQRDDDRLRDTGGEREHLRVTVEVESVEFARFANRLRVGGEIVACSREDQVGLHHTLNVEERAEVTVEKVWKPDQLDRLQEAVAASAAPDVAVATVEEGTAHVHSVAQYGVEERAALSGTTGKGEFAGDRTALFTELGDVLARLDVDAIVLAGPGFTKRDALDVITDAHPDLAEKVTLVDAAAVGDRGVHEVLKRGAVDEIQEETRIAREAELVDDLLERIADGTKAAYGPGAVAEAAEYGAVEHLLVVDDRLRAERAGEGDWDVDVDTIVETVEQQGGDVTVLSGEFDPGERVATLGGIAALLRYRLE